MRAAVFGASGGIGAALVRALRSDARYEAVYALSRKPAPDTFQVDITDEASIAAALGTIGAPLDLVIVASGVLHDAAHGIAPEKGLRAMDPAVMARVFAVNTIGPAMVAKHAVPLMPRDRRAVFAALSARVGSIGDNHLGGWHAYRASKAALNMLIRNLAIELGRSHPQAITAALHPGTVDTALSTPFQRSAKRLFTPDESAAHLLRVIDGLSPEDSGALWAWDGERLPY